MCKGCRIRPKNEAFYFFLNELLLWLWSVSEQIHCCMLLLWCRLWDLYVFAILHYATLFLNCCTACMAFIKWQTFLIRFWLKLNLRLVEHVLWKMFALCESALWGHAAAMKMCTLSAAMFRCLACLCPDVISCPGKQCRPGYVLSLFHLYCTILTYNLLKMFSNVKNLKIDSCQTS